MAGGAGAVGPSQLLLNLMCKELQGCSPRRGPAQHRVPFALLGKARCWRLGPQPCWPACSLTPATVQGSGRSDQHWVPLGITMAAFAGTAVLAGLLFYHQNCPGDCRKHKH